jgi:two-component system sensor histidine kinase KdpD
MEITALLRKIPIYALAATVVVGTTLLLLLGRDWLGTSTVTLFFLLPVVWVTILWGLGPGILTAFTAFLLYNYFFLKPYNTLWVHHSQDLITLVVFLGEAVLISQLVGRARREAETATVRELEVTRLYELSNVLAGIKDPDEIARKVAHHMLEAFSASFVELYAAVGRGAAFSSGESAFQVGFPPDMRKPDRPPEHVIPLQAASRLYGEVRLWQVQPFRVEMNERMLQAFAAQGALALERAMLAQSETRARVLEESDRLKSALLSSVSHELRTPLATIKAAATSLLSDQVEWDTQARHELLAAVDEETDHLNHLVGNLLDMSRIEAGALKPNRQWNLLAEIVDGVLGRMRHLTQQHQLEVDVSDDLPLVPVDYMQIEQVFTNLVSNSIKYAPTGSTVQIVAKAETDLERIHVVVTNEGPPVAPKDLERIFDKFYRVTNAENITGTGLGLSICQGIIQAHGGQIWAENLPGKLAFHFTLPLTWEGHYPSVIEAEEE